MDKPARNQASLPFAAHSAIRQYQMIQSADIVIVALSGGADSMALFRFLLCEAKTFGIKVCAAHVNHGMRGEESDADEAFVRKVCKQHGVALYVKRLICAGKHSEEWARRERYAFLDTLITAPNIKIATAHTASDNAETVLFNLARGAGVRGASGIVPVRGAFCNTQCPQNAESTATEKCAENAENEENAQTEETAENAAAAQNPEAAATAQSAESAAAAQSAPMHAAYIRPLLFATRSTVERYCAENAITYVTDASNLTDLYARNRIRRQLLPLLNSVHPGAEGAIARFACEMREVDDYMASEAAALLQKAQSTARRGDANAMLRSGQVFYDAACLRGAHPALQKAALAQVMRPYCAADKALIDKAAALLQKRAGRLQIARAHTLSLAHGRVSVLPMPQKLPQSAATLPLTEGVLPFSDSFSLKVQCLSYEDFIKSAKVQKKDLFFYADYGKIASNSFFRTRQIGDSFAPIARKVTKSLKKLFNEDGVLPAWRDTVPVLVCNDRVLWVPFYGFCEGLFPQENTKTVITITLLQELEEL